MSAIREDNEETGKKDLTPCRLVQVLPSEPEMMRINFLPEGLERFQDDREKQQKREDLEDRAPPDLRCPFSAQWLPVNCSASSELFTRLEYTHDSGPVDHTDLHAFSLGRTNQQKTNV